MKGVYDSDATEVMECNECGLQYLNPMMSEEEEEEFYRAYYSNVKPRDFKLRDIKQIQAESYTHFLEYQEFYSTHVRNAKHIMEVGSGAGGFLRYALEINPNASIACVERSEENLKYLKLSFKGISSRVLYSKDLSSTPTGKYDLIMAKGVLEHVRNPLEFIKALSVRLKDDNGVMIITVPNKMTPLLTIFDLDAFRKFTYMKQHYYTYTEHSINNLAVNAGLKVEEYRYLQVWGLDNLLSWLRYHEPRDYSNITRYISEDTLNSFKKDMINKKTTDLMCAVLKKYK